MLGSETIATVLPGDAIGRLVGKVTEIRTDDTQIQRRQATVTAFNADGTIQVQLGGSGITLPAVQIMRGLELAVGTSVWIDLKGSDPLAIGHSNTPIPDTGLEAWNVIGAAGQPAFTNGWVNFGAPWGVAAFYKDPDGWVHLKGLIRSGTINTSAFTLPAGYRPPYRWLMSVDSNTSQGTVVVQTDGTVIPSTGNIAYFQLFDISFPTRLDEALWLPVGLDLNGWAQDFFGTDPNWNPNIAVYVRDDGLCVLRGSVKSGTANTDMFRIPDKAKPRRTWIFPGVTSGGAEAFARFDATYNGTLRQVAGGANTYNILWGMKWWNHRADDYPWVDLALQNSWVNYASANDLYKAQILKDKFNVVHLRGTIKNGTVTAGTVITNVPAGYRPLEQQLFMTTCGGSGQFARINVLANGDIQIQAGINGFFELRGSWLAEQ